VKRVIIHSDINNCYASIERQLNPSLAGKPIAVCGAAEERHGIVLAKSYEAKAFGVQTGEAIWQAKNKCHNLIIVSPHYDKYVQYSRLAHEIYKKYTPLIEPYGLDECWLDVSGSVELFGSGEEIAAEIHRRFKEELGLTVSCGVASNKIFAKLGSDMKKPDATTVIPEEGFQELVWPLPVSDLWGVGRQTTKKLDSYCINTIGALAKTNLQFLQERFGVAGTQLWLYANGRDTSRVARYGYIAPIKSIGHGATTAKDMESDEEVWRTILDLTQEIGYKLKKNHLAARGIQINVRDKNLFGCQYQMKLEYMTQSTLFLAQAAKLLFFKKHRFTTPLRSITVRAIDLVPEDTPQQLNLFAGYAAANKSKQQNYFLKTQAFTSLIIWRRQSRANYIRRGESCQNKLSNSSMAVCWYNTNQSGFAQLWMICIRLIVRGFKECGIVFLRPVWFIRDFFNISPAWRNFS